MGRSRIRKIKPTTAQFQGDQDDIFYMSLEEAKQVIGDKYEFLADRYEQQFPKHKGMSA